ncbi:glycosyltransferase [Mammaliicoccus sciuri]|uniref:glycosyltransferase n=1 Tax=Mammaliicoccus sciuri TaxID=1296 RepID=UPI003F54451B
MKLLFVVNNFNFGGPQKSLLNLLYELEDKDVDVDLIILNNQNQLGKYLPKYVNIVEVDSKIPLLMLAKEGILKKLLKNIMHPIFNAKLCIFLIRSLLKLQENVKAKQKFWVKNRWIIKGEKQYYDYAIGVSGGHSIYYIVDYINAKHKIGWIRTDYRVLNRNHSIDSDYFKKIDGMLSVSSMCANIFEDIFQIKPKVFYNSLPIKLYENIRSEKIELIENTVNICTICRLDYGKGLDLLIDAAKILKEKKVNVSWYIVGTGKLEGWLNDEISKNQLQDIVKPVGFKFNTGSIIEKMDFLVHPSRFEGKSNTIDEALYYKKPVVATNFKTVYEQIKNGENGYIVSMNGSDIAKKVMKLANDNLLREKIKSNINSNFILETDKGNEFINIIKGFGKD